MKRALLYCGAAVVVSGLGYVGFVRTTDPDLMTALGSVDVQVRMAQAMPALDQEGRPLAAREQLLLGAEQSMAAALRQAPDSPIAVELQGFLRRLRGDALGAAGCYRRARSLPGCEPEQRDTLVFNEARMRAQAGDVGGALQVLLDGAGAMQPKYAESCSLEIAALMRRCGRTDEAANVLDRLVSASSDPATLYQAGCEYAASGFPALAEAALARATAAVPIADYQRAKLKLAGGRIDTCLGLLDRAAKASPAEVGRMLREDAGVWQALADNERFQQTFASIPAAPGR